MNNCEKGTGLLDRKQKIEHVNLANRLWVVYESYRLNLPSYPWDLRVYPLALIGLLVKRSENAVEEAIIGANVSVETRKYLLDIFNEAGDEMVEAFIDEFTEAELEIFMHSDPSYRADLLGKVGCNFFTPVNVNELGFRILDVNGGDTVADFGCGPGGFLGHVVEQFPGIHATGVEFNHEVACVARLRMEYLAANATVEERNLFECDKPFKYDRIFSNFPFGQRVADLSASGEYAQRLVKGDMPYGRSRNADWAYCQLIVDSLSDTGRAVAILTPSALYNMVDKRVREYFVGSGFVEAVVALPKGLFIGTGIPTELVVFSHGNENVRFVDARDLGSRGRPCFLGSNDVAEILARLSNDGDASVTVGIADIESKDFNLQPERYLWSDIRVSNGMRLGDVSTAIVRGYNVRSDALADESEGNENNSAYLAITDIEDGEVRRPLKRIEKDADVLANHLLQDGDIVIARMALEGGSFKVAAVAVDGDERIVPSQNFYVVTVDKKRVSPVFVAGFLNSDVGQELLSRTTAGETVRNITTDGLRDLIVPVPAMADQQDMAERYQAKLDEISVLKLRLERARMEAASFFESEVE